jgi:UDP-N-acetylmuramoylalanine--D-glutamate ligase
MLAAMDRIASILSVPIKGRVLVVGLDRFGVAASLALRRLGAEVIATDYSKSIDGTEKLVDAGVEVLLGGDRAELVKRAKLVVLSPKIQQRPLAEPIPMEAMRRGVPIMGELELAHRLLGNGIKTPIMAVTGTTGKAVTATLLAHILKKAGQQVFLGGNEECPLSYLYLTGDQVDWIVLEVSSFQLEHLSRPEAFVPQVGIWLNLQNQNLDRHVTMRNYGRTKRRLFEGMNAEQTGVFWLDDSNVNQQHEGLECMISGVSRNPARVPLVGSLLIRREVTPNGWEAPFTLDNDTLAGDENAEYAACAQSAALAIGLEAEIIQAGLDSYPGYFTQDDPQAEIESEAEPAALPSDLFEEEETQIKEEESEIDDPQSAESPADLDAEAEPVATPADLFEDEEETEIEDLKWEDE